MKVGDRANVRWYLIWPILAAAESGVVSGVWGTMFSVGDRGYLMDESWMFSFRS